MRLSLAVLLTWLLLACGLASAATTYPLTYTLSFDTATREAVVEMKLGDHQAKVKRFNLKMPEASYTQIAGDGALERDGDRLLWTPPERGGILRWRHRIEHARKKGGAYDALFTTSWAIFRGDDVFPAGLVRTKGKANSETLLVLKLPSGWHADTPYRRTSMDGYRFHIEYPGRRFDRPVGWMIAGKVGARRDIVVGTEIAVAAPKGEAIHRQDTLAFMAWNLPELKRAFGKLPDKLLIVSGPNPMWRGGLSAPRSLFLHLERPLISENGTSAVLHELTHVITRIRGQAKADWIAEGLAEFYAVEILRRSGGITQVRFDKTIASLKNWGRNVSTLKLPKSTGPTTARAVVLLKALDEEIRRKTDNAKSIDHVTRRLMQIGKVSNAQFVAVVEEVLDGPSQVLASSLLK